MTSLPASFVRPLFAGVFTAVFLAACASAPTSPPGAGTPSGQLDAARFPEIDAAVIDAIAAHQLPGAVVHLERGGQVYERAYGKLSYEPDAAAVGTATLFDAASLTKVLATAP